MRKSIIAPLVVAAAILVQGLALAATPVKDLPPEIAGHVSVRSLRGFIRNIDRFVASASKDSENEIPSGFLSMMAMIYLPVPMEDWDSDGPLNLVILDAPTTSEMPYVAIFQAPDFDRLTETLVESGWAVGDPLENEKYRKVCPVTIPSGESKFLIDAGDGRIVLADNVDYLDVIQESDWFPEHMSEADLRANVALKNKDNPLTKICRELIEKKKDQVVENIDSLGLQPSFARGAGEVLEKYGPLLAGQVDNIRYLLLELHFADGVANVDLGAKFEPGSLGDVVASGMEKSGKLDLNLAGRIPPGALSTAVSYPATRVLPDAPAQVSGLLKDISGMLVPGSGERLDPILKEFYASKPGQAVSGNFLKEGRNYSLSYMPTEDPGRTLDSFVKMIGAVNDSWAKIIVDPDHGVKLTATEHTLDGQPLYHFTDEFANPEKFQELLDRVNDLDSDLGLHINPESAFSIFLTRDDKGVLLGAGDIAEQEFLDAVRHMKEPEGKGLFQNPAVEKLLGRIEFGQGSIGMLDPLGLFNVYMNASSQAHDAVYGQPESNPYRVAMDKFSADEKPSNSVVAFSVGADNGWLLSRSLVPAAAVNEIAKAYDVYEKMRKEAAEDLNVPDAVDERDEDYEDDLEEDEDGEEGEEGEAA